MRLTPAEMLARTSDFPALNLFHYPYPGMRENIPKRIAAIKKVVTLAGDEHQVGMALDVFQRIAGFARFGGVFSNNIIVYSVDTAEA